MTSSDCLSSNNLLPRLSTKSRLNLPVTSIHNVIDEVKKTSSCTSIPTLVSPSQFYTPTANNQHRFTQPNMFPFPRPPPPTAPILPRKNIEFKPPEQEILDNNFFQTFDMKQKEKNINNNTANIGKIL